MHHVPVSGVNGDIHALNLVGIENRIQVGDDLFRIQFFMGCGGPIRYIDVCFTECHGEQCKVQTARRFTAGPGVGNAHGISAGIRQFFRRDFGREMSRTDNRGFTADTIEINGSPFQEIASQQGKRLIGTSCIGRCGKNV